MVKGNCRPAPKAKRRGAVAIAKPRFLKFIGLKRNFDRLKQVLQEAGVSDDVLKPTLTHFITKLMRRTTFVNDGLMRKIMSQKLLGFVSQLNPELPPPNTGRKPHVLLVSGLPRVGKTTACAQIAHYCETTLNLRTGLISATDGATSDALLRGLAHIYEIHGRSYAEEDVLNVE